MLAAYIYCDSEREPAQREVLGDFLEEHNLLRIKWILNGRCESCGGRMRMVDGMLTGYGRCRRKACREEDMSYMRQRGSWVMRCLRELGYVLCLADPHRVLEPSSVRPGAMVSMVLTPEKLHCRGLNNLGKIPVEQQNTRRVACQRCGGLGFHKRGK